MKSTNFVKTAIILFIFCLYTLPSTAQCHVLLQEAYISSNTGVGSYSTTDDQVHYYFEVSAYDPGPSGLFTIFDQTMGDYYGPYSYGTVTISFNADNTAHFLHIMDADDNSCMTTMKTDPLMTCSPTCGDGIMNADETGVDCGGSQCAPCGTACEISTVLTYQDVCDDMGSHDPSDDIMMVGMIVSATNPGPSGQFTVTALGLPALGPYNYGAVSLPIPTNGQTYILSISDEDSPSCYDIQKLAAYAPCGTTCDDGIQNGDETGVDCGGVDCAACVQSTPIPPAAAARPAAPGNSGQNPGQGQGQGQGQGNPNAARLAEEVAEETHTRLYPNPATNDLRVAYQIGGEGAEVDIQILDLAGRTLEHLNFDQAGGQYTENLDVSGLQGGYYFLVLTIGKETKALKFAVLK